MKRDEKKMASVSKTRIKLKCFTVTYIHTVTMAFVRGMKSVNFIVKMKCWLWLKGSELMADELVQLKLLLLMLLV